MSRGKELQRPQAYCLVAQTDAAPISQIKPSWFSNHEAHILSNACAKGKKGGIITFR